MTNFFDTVVTVLKQDERFFTADGELLRNAVYESAMKMDSNLLKLLYQNETTKARFFTDVDGIAVFDKVGFGWVINNRSFLPDSYTRYKNKVGLTNANGDYISTSNDVSLVFPYKDCVLEGGQTKEDQKRSEIFYNETLAPDEVDRLLYPKVLTNAKRYTADGVEENIVNFDDNDNLIIKGNNLLAISSLLHIYSFDGGERFEPDYLLFLHKNNSDGYEQLQVFIEPKGTHLVENDKWKEDFLLEIEDKAIATKIFVDDNKYRIWGFHFFNTDVRMSDFTDDMNRL